MDFSIEDSIALRVVIGRLMEKQSIVTTVVRRWKGVDINVL